MASNIFVRKLARLPLFQGLTQLQLNEIIRGAEYAVYHPGATLIEENAEGDGAILITLGEAVRVSGPELKSRFEPVPTGSLLGETAMLVETTYGSTVVARGEVRGLRILRDKLHAQMAADPVIAELLVQNLASRLLRLAKELREVDAVLCGERRGPPSTLPKASKPASLPVPVH